MARGHTALHTNRLIHETSPYLLQHAHNPVEWYAWGEEAFVAARQQEKPIFLSIGYSTCYWCHVMERECFENETIAQVMNEHFICIKVDREERPDVDDVYMTATQLMTQHGGWPMSVWLEPKELKPFLAGTYFPPDDRHGRPSFPSVLRQIARAWREQRDIVLRQAEQVAAAVRKALASTTDEVATAHGRDGSAAVTQAIDVLMRLYDHEHGGFGGTSGPKFPSPVNLDLLIDVAWGRAGGSVMPAAQKAVLHTLDRMATGGMYDQVGGGFHRYSVDEKWLVPHFEKMLYDNAQLAQVYSRAFEVTGDTFYAEIVRETLEYVLREMTAEEGGFFSAQDAEVDGREGLNYLWTRTEIRETLADADLNEQVDFTLHVYGFEHGTNFRDPHHPEDGPKNVVHLIDRPDRLAASLRVTPDQFNERIAKVNRALLKAREKRDQPATDDKVLAGWNGLMIAGMADGGRVLGEAKYIEAATRAARFVLESMRDGETLLRVYRKGDAKIRAFAEDYAFFIRGMLALNRATREDRWVDEAKRLAKAMRSQFFDATGGGYYDTEEGKSELFVRTKGGYDGAVPSANSVMLLNLLELHEITREQRFLDDALATLKALSRMISERPVAATLGVLGLARSLEKHAGQFAAIAQDASDQAAGDIVAVWLDPESVALDIENETLLRVCIDITEEWHIYASGAGQAGIMPLEIEVLGEGISAVVLYPLGEPHPDSPPLRIHRASIAVPVRLRAAQVGEGRPRVVVSCQPCSGSVCAEPVTVTLPITIER